MAARQPRLPGGPVAPRARGSESTSAGVDFATLRRFLTPGLGRGHTTDVVTDALREAILDGMLTPAAWLREDELAEAFEVSRTPIREALRRLADEGLVVKTAHHGTVVASLSFEEVLALYVVRQNLDSLAARLAAIRCPPDLVEKLRRVGDHMRRDAERGDANALFLRNLEWHRTLREAAGNPYLTRFLNQVEYAVRRMPRTTFTKPGRTEEVLAEHDAVLRAVEAHDPDAAEAAAREHMQRSREVRLSLMLG
jgi:DNA-binding GntR family transcriptional regulator